MGKSEKGVSSEQLYENGSEWSGEPSREAGSATEQGGRSSPTLGRSRTLMLLFLVKCVSGSTQVPRFYLSLST